MNAEPQFEQARPLRISYLFSQFPVPTEAFAVSDINALRAAGHHVTVHTVKPRPSSEADLRALCGVPGDLPILRPDLRNAARWPILLWRFRRAWWALAGRIMSSASAQPRTALSALLCLPRLLEIVEEVRAERSDIVHAFWSRHAGLVLFLLEALGRAEIRSAFVGAYDLVADDFIVDATLNSAEVIFTHAEANLPYADSKTSGRTPVRVIHRGIPLAHFGDDTCRDNLRWVTASALVVEKNVEAVIRAFAAARASEPRLHLSIFGDGPDRARLEGIAQSLGCANAVQFAGHVPRARLFEQLCGSGAFLLLSKKPSERLPNVVKEALWAGCAVISSKSEGIEELIPDQSIGWVVDADDLKATMSAADAVLSESAAAARERRSEARAHIRKRFSSEGSMRRYADAWHFARARRTGAELPAASG